MHFPGPSSGHRSGASTGVVPADSIGSVCSMSTDQGRVGRLNQRIRLLRALRYPGQRGHRTRNGSERICPTGRRAPGGDPGQVELGMDLPRTPRFSEVGSAAAVLPGSNLLVVDAGMTPIDAATGGQGPVLQQQPSPQGSEGSSRKRRSPASVAAGGLAGSPELSRQGIGLQPDQWRAIRSPRTPLPRVSRAELPPVIPGDSWSLAEGNGLMCRSRNDGPGMGSAAHSRGQAGGISYR